VLSHGRVEVGFVRGVPFEISPANSNPVAMNERHWEALDLIIKAWTSHEGPFSHEGRFYHSRRINIWPRPYQQPHPPVWVSTTTPGGAARVGGRGFVQATFLTGFRATPAVFAGYRGGWREAGRGSGVPADRLAYAAFVYVGETETVARANAEKLLWHIAINKIAPQFTNPPGYIPAEANAQMMRAGAAGRVFPKVTTVDQAIELGIMFAGTPEQVHRQITTFHDRVGGFGHLLVIGQSGFLDHDDTVRGIKMLAREVYPRLRDDFPDHALSHDVRPAESAAE
jgi:alkanesulfonate monooxygenase SsuD/methylene tetrahydromethanopterin reductase-like flavin-dependent oxidoreductase (luciferase family)